MIDDHKSDPIAFKAMDSTHKNNVQIDRSPDLKAEKQKVSAAKVAAVVFLAGLFNPLTITFVGLIGVVHLGYRLVKACIIALKPDSLLAKEQAMKEGVREARVATIRNITRNSLGLINNDQAADNVNVKDIKLNYQELMNNADALKEMSDKRILLNGLKSKGAEIKEGMQEKSTNYLFDELQKYSSQEEINAFNLKLENNGILEITEKEIDKFNNDLYALRTRMSELANDSESYKKIMDDLRSLLQSNVYNAIRHDPSQEAVKFLHLTCASLWNDVRAMEAFQTFGDAAIGSAPKDSTTIDTTLGERTASTLEQSIVNVKSELLTDHGIPAKILYAITNPRQALGSLASEGGFPRQVAAFFGKGCYDPHRLLNIPSLQGQTIAKIGNSDQEILIDNVYGGSPTIGDKDIDPIFLAVIHAAENNQFGPSEHRMAEIPDKIFYTNFQDLGKKGGEGPRSVTIMKLNEQYPCAFTGITLTKDSEFYMRTEGLKEWPGVDSFGDTMRTKLMDDSSFSLENRVRTIKNHVKNEDPGFYFPGKATDWQPFFDNIIAAANEVFEDQQPQNEAEVAALCGAYQEFVYHSIQCQMEFKLANSMQQQGLKSPRIHSQRACKENIDRGGVANATYLYLRLPLPQDETESRTREELVAGALHSRALLARGRMILEARLPQNLALIAKIEPDQFMSVQNELIKQQGIAIRGLPEFVVAKNVAAAAAA